ncbi:MAG: amidohydrolase family protein, partial [Candidatus Saccharicenans sp.]|nr:amidohydrolase family protein [Candidatus Saccharicenans sp.]
MLNGPSEKSKKLLSPSHHYPSLKSIFFFLLIVSIFFLQTGCARKPEPADLIITEAKIYTVNPSQPWAEAVAIKGEKIIFVGSARQARKYAGPSTKIIQAGGRLLLPGFQDSHVHFVSGSLNLNRVDLAGTRNVEEIQDRIRQFVAAHPDLPWIQGRGWMYSAFPGDMPHKKFLDE